MTKPREDLHDALDELDALPVQLTRRELLIRAAGPQIDQHAAFQKIKLERAAARKRAAYPDKED